MYMYWRGILVPPCDRNWNWNWRSGIGIGIGIVSSGIGIEIGIVKSENAGIGIGIGIAKSELTPALFRSRHSYPCWLSTSEPVLLESFWSDSDVPMRSSRRLRSWNSTWQGISVSKPLWFRKLSIYYKCMYKCKRFHMFKTKLEWCP